MSHQNKDAPPMRAMHTDISVHSKPIHFEFEGKTLKAFPGDSVAAALTAYNITNLRFTSNGESRGVFCGMGICQECLVEIDGVDNQRACMIKLKDQMKIKRQNHFANPRKNHAVVKKTFNSETKIETPDILVVGGGVGGMSAASIAAECGLNVVLVDERGIPGGQFSKQPTPIHANSSFSNKDPQINLGRKLIKRMKNANVKILNNVQIWGGTHEKDIFALIEGNSVIFKPKRIVVATGAFERPIPVEGWTLPGVMTTGAAQTLLRTYNVIAGKKIFIAGNGPFNIQVALELEKAGASIVGISESALKPGIRSIKSLVKMFRGSPHLCIQGIRYLKEIKQRNIPVYYDYCLSSIQKIKTNELTSVIAPVSSNNSLGKYNISFNSNIVLMGYGFLPSNIILRNLGCKFTYDAFRKQLIAIRNDHLETNIDGVYAVGDCAGLNGAYAACEEGIIAGIDAVKSLGHKINKEHHDEYLTSVKSLNKCRMFQSGFWKIYSSKLPNVFENNNESFVCRCEQVTFKQIQRAINSGCISIKEFKQRTRIGMGRCQGRYCASFLSEIIESETNLPLDEEMFFAPRYPIIPVKIGELTKKFSES